MRFDILVVARGDARIDNKKFKQVFQVKAKMLSTDDVLEITGHPVGDVCPFGLRQDMDIFLDKGLVRQDLPGRRFCQLLH